MENLKAEDLMRLNQIYKKQATLKLEIKDLENEYNRITLNMKVRNFVVNGQIYEEPKIRHLRIGKKKFNIDPEEGLHYLITENVIAETPVAVASFLSDYTLNKKSVGNYLGDISNEFNCKVLLEYINMFDFSGMEYVDALRLFLAGFQLPGESQKIDKIVLLWAKHYNKQNPGYFKDETEAYVMTFAVIMLNTCLYNKTAKKHNSGFGREEDFVKIMKDFDANTHFDLTLTKKVFRNIKSQPLLCNKLIKNEDDIFVNSLMSTEKSGWLWKLGGRIKSWKKRWFVLCESNLFYLLNPDSPNLKGVILLENLLIRKWNKNPKNYTFEIYSNSNQIIKSCKCNKNGSPMQGHHFTYKIYCCSKLEMEQWMEAIQRNINNILRIRLMKNIN